MYFEQASSNKEGASLEYFCSCTQAAVFVLIRPTRFHICTWNVGVITFFFLYTVQYRECEWVTPGLLVLFTICYMAVITGKSLLLRSLQEVPVCGSVFVHVVPITSMQLCLRHLKLNEMKTQWLYDVTKQPRGTRTSVVLAASFFIDKIYPPVSGERLNSWHVYSLKLWFDNIHLRLCYIRMGQFKSFMHKWHLETGIVKNFLLKFLQHIVTDICCP